MSSTVKYHWHFEDPLDWGTFLDEVAPPEKWRHMCQWPSQFLGGVLNCHRGSAGILLAYREIARRYIDELSLDKTYKWFVFTRSDQMHLCPHPRTENLDEDSINVPEGEDYGGISDRHTVYPAALVLKGLNVTQHLLHNSPEVIEHFGGTQGLKPNNLESILKFYFDKEGLEVRRFNRTCFGVKRACDLTRWSAGSDHPVLKHLKLTAKYPTELALAERSCGFKLTVNTNVTYTDECLQEQFLRDNNVIGPIDLSTLPLHVLDAFTYFNMEFKGITKWGKYSIDKDQVPRQAFPFMIYHNSTVGWSKNYSTVLVDTLLAANANGEDISCAHYPESAYQIKIALERVNMAIDEPVKVLVAGSISPWVEIMILSSDLKLAQGMVSVTDYNPIIVEDSRIEFVHLLELQNQSSIFDVVVSHSRIEHDGLGRYGDPVDPNGDFKAMAEFHIMLRDKGFLVLGVPTVEDEDTTGSIEGNFHRIYSAERRKQLFCGFDVVGKRILTQQKLSGWQHQDVYVLQKTKSVNCYAEIIKKISS